MYYFKTSHFTQFGQTGEKDLKPRRLFLVAGSSLDVCDVTVHFHGVELCL